MTHHRFSASILVIAAYAMFTVVATADVTPDKMFSDHMVLQRDMPVPVWGTAAPDEEVTVAFAGQEKKTKADKDGKWMVKLDPLKVGKPGKMTISGKNSITFDDVLVGEVWIGSGQSNMAGGTGGYAKGDEVLAKMAAGGPYPNLRLYRNGWQESTPQNINGFSAIHFSFGLPLQKELDVPVGLMVGAVGGTPSGRWLSKEMFEDNPACVKMLKEYAAKHSVAEAKKKYEQALAKWEKAAKAAKDAGKRPPRKPRAPMDPSNPQLGDLYQSKIEYMVPYAIRGVLWDQGESGTRIAGVDQFTTMGGLIGGWRKVWGQGEFPFLYVQKPSGGGSAWDKKNPVTRMANDFTANLPDPNREDGKYREHHIGIMNHPNTMMVTAVDLGSGIHPRNKSGYGTRAAQVALGKVYGKDVAIYGPIYDSHKVDGNKVRVKFQHVNKGLAFRGGDKLQGFAIAGNDKVFHWADATIDGDTIVLSSEKVTKPVAVRYAWGRNPTWANLFNKDGLPALTFRTDEW